MCMCVFIIYINIHKIIINYKTNQINSKLYSLRCAGYTLELLFRLGLS